MEPAVQQATTLSYEGGTSAAGLFHGQGRAVFASGLVYDGAWHNGMMEGDARLAFPDGVEYEGSMHANSMEGTGVYRWPGATYEGEVLNGKRHGQGVIAFEGMPAVYEGEWADGMRHGRGTLYFNPERTAFYEGEWFNDMKQGRGTMVYPSGNVYEGGWVADQKRGHGTMQWHTLGQTYSGQWVRDMPNGLGQHVWEQELPAGSSHATCLMQNRYCGMFLDGRRHGEGALLYSSGARYEGTWVADKKEGEAVYVFENGMVFTGRFAADRPVLESGAFSYGSGGSGTAEGRPGSSSTCKESGLAATGGSTAAMPAGAQQARKAPAGAVAAATEGGGAAQLAGAQSAGGFGPRVSYLQLHIDDLLEDEESPVAAAKSVLNLLTGFNSELRSLYDRYCKRASPFTSPAQPRTTFGLQAAQLWELTRDAGLISRHTPLCEVDAAIARARAPPPPVAARRARVLQAGGAAAAAVLGDVCGPWPVLGQPGSIESCQSAENDGEQLQVAVGMSSSEGGNGMAGLRAAHDPLTELSFREFSEALVRISSLRYPAAPSLPRRVQTVLQQHIAPLIASARQQRQQQAAGGGGLSATGSSTSVAASGNGQHRQSQASSGSGPLGGGAGTGAAAALNLLTWEQQLVSEEVVGYLRSRGELLQAVFAAVAANTYSTPVPGSDAMGGTGSCEEGTGSAAAGDGSVDVCESGVATARAVVCRLERAGVLAAQKLGAGAVAGALLEGLLGAKDAVQARLRLDVEPDEPPEAAEDDAGTAALQAAEWHAREVALWADQPLTYPEFVWGLARVALLLPLPPRARSPMAARHVQRMSTATGYDAAGGLGSQQQAGSDAPAMLAGAAAGGMVVAGGFEDRGSGLIGALQRLLEGPSGLLALVLTEGSAEARRSEGEGARAGPGDGGQQQRGGDAGNQQGPASGETITADVVVKAEVQAASGAAEGPHPVASKSPSKLQKKKAG